MNKKIIDLLLSQEKSNRKLGFVLEESQKEDLSLFWDNIFKIENSLSKTLIPTKDKKKLENIFKSSWEIINLKPFLSVDWSLFEKFPLQVSNITFTKADETLTSFDFSIFPKLSFLDLGFCDFHTLPKLPQSIENLRMNFNYNLKSFEGIEQYTDLLYLAVYGLSKELDYTPIKHLTNLKGIFCFKSLVETIKFLNIPIQPSKDPENPIKTQKDLSYLFKRN